MTYRKASKILLRVTWLLLLFGLIACSMLKPPTVEVMPEARVVLLEQGQPTPFRGYLISASAMAKLMEAAERCQTVKP